MDLARELKKNKLWNTKVMVILIVIGALATISKGLIKGLEDFEIRGQGQTHQIKIGKNIRKSPGD